MLVQVLILWEIMNSNDICEVTFIDDEKVNQVKQKLPGLDEMNNLSESFKVLADPTRLKIILILSAAELCVCDITALLSVSVSAVSHHLRLLRSQRMVKFRKVGKMVYYTLDDSHIENIITEAINHINE